VRVFAGKRAQLGALDLLLTQIIVTGYLWAASLGYGYPELFSIAGESKREICARW
jgi:hypothetical protein